MSELVECSSRLVMLAKLADGTAASALEGFTAKLRGIAEPMRQTLTYYDQGKEMARHAELTTNTGIKGYFCDPHTPWQRGSCENINGPLRLYLPKGTDLSVFSQEQLVAIADRRVPGHVGKDHSTRFLNSMNPVLHLVLDTAWL